ncbi:ABC transporter ATP-binding protein [Rubellimicrobium sp. CFH 75288]|uniref:ABC transporter ATP-binding protein n=1 Tax=Rubellimicrobium sp. CFH 75288 TaxID=2697034 RepID=UPI0014132DAF|nr:ABC transporter ATP-binding protein [Rubellimicrobium sp. CFH 75288]NAZ38102.1 ATP-binding cassette domain-containing protein [Rubellimicrobium sp. CFH 75288]
MAPILSVRGLRKVYDNGFEALKGVDLDVQPGEILALLGPNGAGKTTLISCACGLSTPTAGTITVGGYDIRRDWRAARSLVGLVPQEITLESFEKVKNTVAFSRGLWGKPRDDAAVERVLRRLSLWDKAEGNAITLSGGMKRRVLIAKALAHEPRLLFLDEPTAGVDVELRRDMWRVVDELRRDGVTIILTTHYIEEAEAIADRVAVINKGRILLVEDKATLMRRMGRKVLRIDLQAPLATIPERLGRFGLALGQDGRQLSYEYDTKAERTGIATLLAALAEEGIAVADLDTEASSLEEIFVDLVARDGSGPAAEPGEAA